MSVSDARRRPRWPLSGALALACVLVLAACGSPATQAAGPSPDAGKSAPDLSSVTLRAGDQQRRLETMMRAAGELNGLKYQVQWAEFSSGPPMLQAMAAGGLDLGRVGNTPPIFSQAAGGTGAEIRVVAASSEGGDKDALLVPAGSNITTVAQLKGKKVAVARGSSAHLTLLLALKKAGLSWSQIDAVNLQPQQAQSAFSTHQIDAWAVWYPFIAVAKTDGARVLLSGTSLDAGLSLLVSDVQTLQDGGKVAALHDFLHRVVLAQRWANNHIGEWSSLYAQISGLSPAAATETVRNLADTFVPIDSTVAKDQQSAADEFTSAELIPKIDVSKIQDGRFNKDTRLS